MPTAGPAREETTFYSDSLVRVTNARLMIGQTTYAMLNITSVMTAKENPSIVGPVLLLTIGAICFIGGLSGGWSSGGVTLGFLMVGIGGGWLKERLKPKYHLRISSSSGEANVVTSKDKQTIEKMVQAVNEAMIGAG